MYSIMTLEEKKKLLADMIQEFSEEECGCLLDELRRYRDGYSLKDHAGHSCGGE